MKDTELINHFQHLYELIQRARTRALLSVNYEQLHLLWQVGAYIDQKLAEGSWGEKVVDQFSAWLKEKDPSVKNFDRRNIYRMREFFLAYHNVNWSMGANGLSIVGSTKPQIENTDNEGNKIVVSAKPQLPDMPDWLGKIPWTHHIHILSACKETEERVFYVLLTEYEKYTVKELRRQLKSSLYERQKLSSKNIIATNHPKADKIPQVLRDRYVFEFLDLPESYSENDLQKALVARLKKFLLELGRDFAYMGEEYRLIVGMKDFRSDLLFFHRELQCIVAFELKTTEFEPEYLGKLNFYLEALDRDIKKPHENPSIGVLLCKTKNQEVVEYALSRNMSPALFAEYQTRLIDKGMLKKLLHEWTENIESNTDES
jgi:predicted nuclease of restriction endonuclease-like (RecB) superfamily